MHKSQLPACDQLFGESRGDGLDRPAQVIPMAYSGHQSYSLDEHKTSLWVFLTLPNQGVLLNIFAKVTFPVLEVTGRISAFLGESFQRIHKSGWSEDAKAKIYEEEK